MDGTPKRMIKINRTLTKLNVPGSFDSSMKNRFSSLPYLVGKKNCAKLSDVNNNA